MSIKAWLLKKGLQGKLPDWLYRLLGKEVAKKLDLQETTMEDNKPFYKSKAKMAAIIGVILAGIQPISKAFGHEIIVPNFVFEVLAGMGLYGVRDAIGK